MIACVCKLVNNEGTPVTMAKKDKAEKAAKSEKKESAPEFKFGVADLAEKLGIEPASVRVQLRNRKIEKAGKSYGWNTKAELQEVVDQLKAKAEKADKPAKADKKAKKGKKAKKDD